MHEELKSFANKDPDFSKEQGPKEAVERGKEFLEGQLAKVGQAVIHYLKFDQPPNLDGLAVSSILAAAGAAYLYIRREFPGPEADLLWHSLQNFISHDLPQVFASLKNGEIPQWDTAKNIGAADTLLAVITSFFSIKGLKEAAHLVIAKINKQASPASYE